MKTHFDIEQIIKKGKIDNELDLERALIADRQLRLLAKEDTSFVSVRKKLRDIIEEYESRVWSNNKITSEKIAESDIAEYIAEKEREFISQRKMLIKNKLKSLNATQQELGLILGHKSKTHMSELMNGTSPFPLKDIIIMNRLLKIDITYLLPIFLSKNDQLKVKSAIVELKNPKIKLTKEDLEFA